jgi:hypothetical protein
VFLLRIIAIRFGQTWDATEQIDIADERAEIFLKCGEVQRAWKEATSQGYS